MVWIFHCHVSFCWGCNSWNPKPWWVNHFPTCHSSGSDHWGGGMLDPCDAYWFVVGWLGTLSWFQLTPRHGPVMVGEAPNENEKCHFFWGKKRFGRMILTTWPILGGSMFLALEENGNSKIEYPVGSSFGWSSRHEQWWKRFPQVREMVFSGGCQGVVSLEFSIGTSECFYCSECRGLGVIRMGSAIGSGFKRRIFECFFCDGIRKTWIANP